MINYNLGIVATHKDSSSTPIPVDPNKLVDIGTGEYVTVYKKQNGEIYTVPGNDGLGYTITKVNSIPAVTELDGGQYHATALTANGVYSIHVNNISATTYATHYPTDNLSNPFNPESIYSIGRCIVALQAGQVYYWSVQDNHDILNQFGGSVSNVPRLLTQVPGKTIVKIVAGANFPTTYALLLGLASDGTVWRWSTSNTTPVQVTGGWSGTIKDIALMSIKATVLETTTGQLWGWGYLGSHVGALDSWQNPNPQNITSVWQGAGVTFPLKKIVSSYNVLYIIDNNNDLYVSGQNVQGQFGNGQQWLSWKTYSPTPYLWSLNNSDTVISTPVKLRGKWNNIKCNNTVVFYTWGEDMNGNWYSWGRNKARCLGNGVTLTISDESNYSEYYNIPAPRKQNPIAQLWTVMPSVNINANRKPIAHAGIDQYLAANTTNTTLYGEYSHQQQPNNSVTITMAYNWSLVSGPNTPTIVSPNSQNTVVNGLINGTYIFNLLVTSSYGSDNINVTVNIG